MKKNPFYYDKDGKPYKGDKAIQQWGKDFDNPDKRVIKQTFTENGYFISSIWLGIDHAFGLGKKPLIYETMVFKEACPVVKKGQPKTVMDKLLHKHENFCYNEIYQTRHTTKRQALLEHALLVKKYGV